MPLLFTENETNTERLFGRPNASAWVKDGINDCVVGGRREAVNPAQVGTKAAAHHRLSIAPGETRVLRLRLTDAGADAAFGAGFDDVFAARAREADAFYDVVMPASLSEDQRRVMRQALAGMLWSKQHYFLAVDSWLEGHGANPFLGQRATTSRNADWYHMLNDDVISMPDKWEYPWYAAWDLAFHTVALSVVDIDFAKQQLELMLSDLYMHPSGQIPAYEWNFGDVNPPVHAFATLFVYQTEKALRGEGDLAFLRRAFHGLTLNFTWWLNRKDPSGRQRLRGRVPRPRQHRHLRPLEPAADRRTARAGRRHRWMALFSQNMLEIAIELAQRDPIYEEAALKYFEHYFWIAAAMDRIGDNARRDVGRGRRLLLRRAAPARRRRHAPQGALDGGIAAALRHRP